MFFQARGVHVVKTHNIRHYPPISRPLVAVFSHTSRSNGSLKAIPNVYFKTIRRLVWKNQATTGRLVFNTTRLGTSRRDFPIIYNVFGLSPVLGSTWASSGLARYCASHWDVVHELRA